MIQMKNRWHGLLAIVTVLSSSSLFADPDLTAERNNLRKVVSFYASFDEALRGDFGQGDMSLRTRFDSATEKGAFDFEPGFDPRLFRVAKQKGVHGGALEVTGVLPRRGRIFFPAKDNIAYRADGWGGAVSFWLNTNPNTSLQTPFCDPVQITEKGAGNGGIWCDFPDVKPRDMRLGAFPAVPLGGKPIPESAPDAPLVRLVKVGFQVGEWHHVVLSWTNFDTGKSNATAVLYVDGKRIGDLRDREIAMRWNLEKTGIYIALSYIGLMDELAVFQRALSDEEVSLLHRTPDLLAGLKTPAKPDGASATGPADLEKLLARERKSAPPSPPAFPFDAAAAKKYQQDYATWLGVPTTIRNHVGQELVLVPPGQFMMGSPENEPGRNNSNYDETQHLVRLTQPFYLARHETTVGQFRAFVEKTQYVTDGERNDGGHAHDELAVWQHRPGTTWRRPGYAAPLSLADNHPVVHVSHTDAMSYCRWLNENGVDSARYDLPTEAEWEWSCRAGAATRFWWGEAVDDSGKVVNVGDAQLREVHPKWPREVMPMNDGHAFLAPVGTYRANAFGLHDMLGNVWEFCSTRFGKYPAQLTTNPVDLAPDRGFAVRGGGWSNTPQDARSATRNADPPHFCHSNLGFRVAIKLTVSAEDRPSANLSITTRQQVKVEGQPDQFRSVQKQESWNPTKTAIVIIDMWDTHSCRSAAQRVVEMAPHVNRTISAARDKGVFIIHAPSDCMEFYKEAPQRQRAINAPPAEASVKFQWNYFNPDREGPLAEKLEKGGCSCDTPEPCGPSRIVWHRQIDTIKIHPSDAVTANGQEVYNLLQERGIDNVIIIGVHTNRCVLGRPFGIRQMASLKKNVVLCRDLTDSFHRDPGHHFEGLDQIILHVEKYWCPTITSETLTGQPPFRFQQAGVR